MSLQWSYFGIENIALTAGQRATLIAALQAIGPASDSQPSHIHHWRVRLDNDAVIFEAAYDSSELTVAAFKQYLATTFGVAVGQITSAASSATFDTLPSTVLTFSYQATARMRAVLFGGVSASHAESRDEAAAYLASNSAAWDAATP